MTTRLDVSIGPVQDFVAQSRRTRDLWGSSYLLSVLSAYAMRGAEEAAGYRGKIVSPAVEDDPLYKWISGARNGNAPQIGSLPNHFVVEVEADKRPEAVARAATRALEDAWQQVCDAVRRCIVQKVQNAGCGTEAIWERQTRNFWEIVWTVGTGPGGGNLLARRKQWRCHRPLDEPGDKCTVMHDFQELSGYVRAESMERQEEFWRRIRDHHLVGPLDLREGERLCAIALVKRLFPLVPGALDWWVDHARSWPSTVYIGAAPWIERVRSVAPLEAERYAKAVTAAGATGDETGGAFTRLDANWFHIDFVRDDRRCPIPSTHTESRAREDLVRHLMAIYQTSDDSGRPLGKPSAFYALLKADGDRLGKLVSGSGSELVGNALAKFTREVPEIVKKHGGVTVYAGGDDVLAMLPVPHALLCAEELEKRYRCAFEECDDATLSAAVLFTHARSPLRSAFGEAGRLLDEVAKDGNGRDSLAVGVLKPGGLHCQWVTTWTRCRSERNSAALRSLELLDLLVQRLRRNDGDPGLSSSLVYRIRETLSFLCEQPRWEPGTWADPLKNLEIRAFLRAEIFRSLNIRSGKEADKQASEWTELVQRILPRAGRKEGDDGAAPVGVDGLLLARFLTDPDDEEVNQ